MKHIVVIELLLLIFISCSNFFYNDRGDESIMLINRSERVLASFPADEFRTGFSYPDTLPTLYNPPMMLRQHIVDSAYVLSYGGCSWREALSLTKSGRISIYLLSQDVIDNYSWEEISTTPYYLVRYDLTIKDLNEGLHYIYYPPTDEMKDIYMYPDIETVITQSTSVLHPKEEY